MLDLDVVIPVHNAPDHVRACLDSVAAALRGRGTLILVDDASDEPTRTLLDERAAATGATLVRHTERTGYTKAVNDGARAGRRRNVMFLNSDTIVPPRALDRLSTALDRHRRLAVVGPLSNAASLQSVPSTSGTGKANQTAINPLPPGVTPADLDAMFARRRWGALTYAPLVHGFCFTVKRAAFERLGGFDEETFADGYGEENDFSFRAVDAGYRLGILTNTYIFHAKSASYQDAVRVPLLARSAERLDARHGPERLQRASAELQANVPLARAREMAAAFYAARTAAV